MATVLSFALNCCLPLPELFCSEVAVLSPGVRTCVTKAGASKGLTVKPMGSSQSFVFKCKKTQATIMGKHFKHNLSCHDP